MLTVFVDILDVSDWSKKTKDRSEDKELHDPGPLRQRARPCLLVTISLRERFIFSFRVFVAVDPPLRDAFEGVSTAPVASTKKRRPLVRIVLIVLPSAISRPSRWTWTPLLSESGILWLSSRLAMRVPDWFMVRWRDRWQVWVTSFLRSIIPTRRRWCSFRTGVMSILPILAWGI